MSQSQQAQEKAKEQARKELDEDLHRRLQSQQAQEKAKEQARKELLETLDRRETYLNKRKLFLEESISKHESKPPQNKKQEIFFIVTLQNLTEQLEWNEIGIRNFAAFRERELAILDDPNFLRRERWAKEDAARAAAHREKEAAKELQDAQELPDAEWDEPKHCWPEEWPENAKYQECLDEDADFDSSEHDSDEEELRKAFFGDVPEEYVPPEYDGDHDINALSWQWQRPQPTQPTQPTQTTQPTHTNLQYLEYQYLEDLLVAQQERRAREFNAQCEEEEQLQHALLLSQQEFQNAQAAGGERHRARQTWSSDFVPRAGAAGGERHRPSQSSINHDEMQLCESDDEGVQDWFPPSSTRDRNP